MSLSFDFAFEGFRTIRAQPRLIAWWGAVTLAGNSLALILLISLSGQALAGLMPMVIKGEQPDMIALQSLTEQALPGMALYTLVNLMTASIIATAACRAALGQAGAERGFLALGMEELRMFLVHAFMAILTIVALSLGSAIGAIGGQAGSVLGMLTGGGVALWLRVRLSLNGPMSFQSGRVDLFGSFVVTAPVMWRLALGYVMMLSLVAAVWFLCRQVIETLITLIFGEIGLPDMSSVTAYLTPATIVILVLSGGIIAPLISAILYGAPAAAWRVLRASAT